MGNDTASAMPQRDETQTLELCVSPADELTLLEIGRPILLVGAQGPRATATEVVSRTEGAQMPEHRDGSPSIGRDELGCGETRTGPSGRDRRQLVLPVADNY